METTNFKSNFQNTDYCLLQILRRVNSGSNIKKLNTSSSNPNAKSSTSKTSNADSTPLLSPPNETENGTGLNAVHSL